MRFIRLLLANQIADIFRSNDKYFYYWIMSFDYLVFVCYSRLNLIRLNVLFFWHLAKILFSKKLAFFDMFNCYKICKYVEYVCLSLERKISAIWLAKRRRINLIFSILYSSTIWDRAHHQGPGKWEFKTEEILSESCVKTL